MTKNFSILNHIQLTCFIQYTSNCFSSLLLTILNPIIFLFHNLVFSYFTSKKISASQTLSSNILPFPKYFFIFFLSIILQFPNIYSLNLYLSSVSFKYTYISQFCRSTKQQLDIQLFFLRSYNKLNLQMILQSNQTEYTQFSKYFITQRTQIYQGQSTDDQYDTKSQRSKKNLELKFIPQISKFKPTEKKIKYKTEMCKNFSEMGYCNYKNKCQYAHGYNQLSFPQTNCVVKKSYRTKKCKSFWQNGVCFYGIRCQFSHHEIKQETKLYLRVLYETMKEQQPFFNDSKLKKICKE